MAIEAIASEKILELDHKRPHTFKRWMLKNVLLFLIIGAVVLGLAVGFAARLLNPSKWAIWIVEFPGKLMLSMIKLVILPLIVSSLISGIAQLDVRHLGKIGGLAVSYYLTTTLLAVLLGIALVILIRPGNRELYNNYKEQQGKNVHGPNVGFVSTTDSILDVIRNIFPENLVQATMQSVKTVKKIVNATSQNGNVTIMSEKYELEYKNGTNILGIIVFCIAFGIVLSQLGEAAKTMIDLIAILEKITMKLVSWIIWFTPIGVFSLISGSVLAAGDFLAFIQIIGLFLITANVGLALHFFVTLPGIYYATTRQNPIIFLKSMSRAMATAFGTASSSATLPVSLHCLEEGMKIDKRVTRFVVPLGATINMDGLALYESVAVIFIAQMQFNQNETLPLSQIIMIILTATLSSIGAAAVPQGGIVAMIMVLAAINLPADDIVLILAVDWFMDRLRTMVNVIGDAYGACIVAHYCGDQLDAAEKKDNDDKIMVTVGSERRVATDSGSGSNIPESGASGHEEEVQQIPVESIMMNDPVLGPEATSHGYSLQDASKTAPLSSAMLSPKY